MSGTVWITYPADGARQNSIIEHGLLLAGALRRHGRAAETAEPAILRAELPPGDVVWLQYNPFAYGRGGVAPRLLASVGRLTRRRERPRLCLYIHEPYVPLRPDRTLPMAVWQRGQLRRLVRDSDCVVGATGRWCALARRLGDRSRRTYHLPVGSGLPDRRDARAAMRTRLGIDDTTLVVAQFGTDHPSRSEAHAQAAVERLLAGERPFVFLNLGLSARRLTADDRVREILPGYLEREELARHLSAADVFLSPCVDGVSTRRTSLIAALQHGVAAVGTERPDTDAQLRGRSGLRLVPVDDVSGFADAVHGLAAAGVARAAAADARALFEREFDWDVIGARAGQLLDEEASRA